MSTGLLNKANPSVRRILKEVRELQLEGSWQLAAAPLDDNIYEWHFTIRGPGECSCKLFLVCCCCWFVFLCCSNSCFERRDAVWGRTFSWTHSATTRLSVQAAKHCAAHGALRCAPHAPLRRNDVHSEFRSLSIFSHSRIVIFHNNFFFVEFCFRFLLNRNQSIAEWSVWSWQKDLFEHLGAPPRDLATVVEHPHCTCCVDRLFSDRRQRCNWSSRLSGWRASQTRSRVDQLVLHTGLILILIVLILIVLIFCFDFDCFNFLF